MATKWNPTNGGQQPSLEESLQQIREKWKSRYGQGKGGGGGGGKFLSSIIVVLAILAAAWTSFFTVQPEQTGVVQRFGAVNRTADPGLHFKWPFGMETVILVPTERVLKEEFGFRTASVRPGERTRYVESRAYQDESPDSTLREFVRAVRDHRVGQPDADAVARYDGRALTRRLAGYLDCLAEQAAARAAGARAAAGRASRRAG